MYAYILAVYYRVGIIVPTVPAPTTPAFVDRLPASPSTSDKGDKRGKVLEAFEALLAILNVQIGEAFMLKCAHASRLLVYTFIIVRLGHTTLLRAGSLFRPVSQLSILSLKMLRLPIYVLAVVYRRGDSC